MKCHYCGAEFTDDDFLAGRACLATFPKVGGNTEGWEEVAMHSLDCQPEPHEPCEWCGTAAGFCNCDNFDEEEPLTSD